MWVLVAYATVVYLLGFPARADAYVDPGTGSLLLQSFAFVFLMAGMFFRRVQGFVTKYLFRKRADRQVDEP